MFAARKKKRRNHTHIELGTAATAVADDSNAHHLDRRRWKLLESEQQIVLRLRETDVSCAFYDLVENDEYSKTFEFYGAASIDVLVGGAVTCDRFVLRRGERLDCYAPITGPVCTVRCARLAAVAQLPARSGLSSTTQLSDADRAFVDALSAECGDLEAVVMLSHLELADDDRIDEIFDASRVPADDIGDGHGGIATAIESMFAVRWQTDAKDETNKEWSAFFDWLRRVSHPTVVVIGRVGVGKSTFCRRIVNELLNGSSGGSDEISSAAAAAVRWLDADVGQPELTVAGVLALTELTSPLIGTALARQAMSHFDCAYFYGDVEPSSEPARWQAQIDALLALHRGAPRAASLVVNTHGWLDGVGRDLVRHLVRAAQPTAVVELLATGETPSLAADLLGDVAADSQTTMVFRLPSAAVRVRMPQLPAVTVRRLMLLRHVAGSVRASALLDVRPRRVSFAHVRVALPRTVQPVHALRALNASVVALCCDAQHYELTAPTGTAALQLLPSAPRLAHCLALGAVRAIDVQQRVFYIVTTLDDALLAHVNTLVLGALTLPPDAIVQAATHNSSIVQAPYVARESLAVHEAGGAVERLARRDLPRR